MTKPKTIKTLKDLIDSDLKIAIEDIVYTRDFFIVSMMFIIRQFIFLLYHWIIVLKENNGQRCYKIVQRKGRIL